MLQAQKSQKYPLLFSHESAVKNNVHTYHLAWQEAKKIAEILKKEFGAKSVSIFGSLTDPERFNENSDIDIAVRGIPDEKFYSAVGKATRISDRFQIDVVDLDDCRESVRKSIENDGIPV